VSGEIVVVSPYRIEYGPPQTLGHVARALAEADFHPLCLVPPGARLSGDLERSGADVRVMDRLATFPRTLNPLRLRGFLREHVECANEIEAIARAGGARAVYSISEAIFAGALAARRRQIPSIVHVIGMSIQSPRVGAHVYVRLLDRLTDRFVACSAAVAEMLVDHGVSDEKVTVVHNGIPVAEIEATASSPPLDLPPGPRVGMVAAYDPRKGHELFVEAAALVATRLPNARFYLIGGTLEGQPESLAFERRVEWLIRDRGLDGRFERPGFVPQPEVFSWLRAMDVVVVPSKTEAFAHALPEAMLCGAAVVATAIEGNLDAFAHGHSGLYADPTPASIADGILALLDDPERARAIGDAARRRARLFDLKVTLPALAATVTRLVEPWALSSAASVAVQL